MTTKSPLTLLRDADYSLQSALDQMRGLYALMIEFKVPHARAANSAAHVESAIRHLHRLAMTADASEQAAARPAPVVATVAPRLPEFIAQNVERAIEDALHPKGMHTNGKCMAQVEVTQLQCLLRAARAQSLAAAPAAPIAEPVAWANRAELEHTKATGVEISVAGNQHGNRNVPLYEAAEQAKE